jgi:uncharacterized membrane protein SpoIIM required for sporulation
MVGVFQFMFMKYGVLAESARGIWIHGTLEISAIIIAGGSGIVVGNSILFPGTYKRLDSFTRGSKKGIKILVGLVPQILIAAVLESFVTRFSNDSPLIGYNVIGVSFVFVIWYYIVYPIMMERKLRA